jgi:hypothetical protein
MFLIIASLFLQASIIIYAEEVVPAETTGSTLKYYEFEDLIIKVKIQEPEVLFILDKPSVQVEPFEDQLNFLYKIEDPILKNNLF